MFDLSVATTDDDLAALREPWDRLRDAHGPPDLQMSHRWITAWWECYRANRELLLLIVRRDRDIIGIAPLMIDTAPDGTRELASLGRDNLDYWDFLIADDRQVVLRLMFRYLFEHWTWTRIDLAELREDSLNLPYIAPTVESLGGTAVTMVGCVCPYIAPATDWESYYAGRSRKLRADVRRRRKKLAVLGRIRFSRIRTATEDLWPTLDALRAVNRIHYGARRLLNLDKHEAKIRYIRSLVAFLSETGTVDIASLWCGERLIAYNLGYRCHDIVNYWNTGFDPRLAEHSPGKLLLAELIESTCREGAAEFNFLRGDESYKFEWTNASRKNYLVQITR